VLKASVKRGFQEASRWSQRRGPAQLVESSAVWRRPWPLEQIISVPDQARK